MRQDMRKFEGPGEGQWESGQFLFVHDSAVAQLW